MNSRKSWYVFQSTGAASILMWRYFNILEVPMNFDAVFKNAKILKIGPVEQKLWKIRQNVGVKIIFTGKKFDRKNWITFESYPLKPFCQLILKPNFILHLGLLNKLFHFFPPWEIFSFFSKSSANFPYEFWIYLEKT